MTKLPKDELQMPSNHDKSLISLATRKVQTKPMLRFHLTPVRMAVIKKIIYGLEIPFR